MRGPGRTGERSFALVSSLLIVAVMALGALAFFQAARLDRLVTRSTAEAVRAGLAAESGLAAAAALLQAETTNDTFVITLNATNRQLFAGNQRGSGRAAGFSYRPLFSAVPDPSNLAVPAILTAGVPSQVATGETNIFTNVLPGGGRATSPVVSWVYLTNGQGRTNARFAFWVEDLGGRLDLGIMGTTNTNRTGGRVGGMAAPSTRPPGTNAEEIALWSVFSPGNAGYVSNDATRLVEARGALLTPASARHVLSDTVASNVMGDFTARLVHDTNEVEVIPYGFGYTNAGRAKFNINDYIEGGNFSAVATIISNNLPNFGTQRMGGFPPGEDYTLTIAASAIDYADINSTPSVGTGYRGVDATPFTTTLYNKYDWYQRNPDNIRLRLSTFVQIWNLSDQNITGNFTITQTNNDVISEIGWSPGVLSYTTNGISLTTNGVLVLKFEDDVAIPTGVFPITNTTLTIPANNQYSFSTFWNGALCDMSRGAGERIQKTLGLQPAAGGPDWSGFMPGLRYLPYTTNISAQQCGDPRATYYLNATMAASDFDLRSAWGGMAVMRPAGGRYQTRPWIWADPITNDAVSVPEATSGASLSTTISNVSQLTNGSRSGAAAHAVQRINNSGAYRRITELGNLYDPAQWNYSGYPSNSIPADTVTDAADSSYGGGISLRIGKAEHPKFTNDGTRASQLLDLFAAGPPSTAGGRVRPLTSVTNRVAGKINLNTATTNTLRALAAGVYHTNDSFMLPDGANFVVPAGGVDAFITGVTNFRSQRPFLSTSQLNDIATSTNSSAYPESAVFGNRTFGTSNNFVTYWNDAAAEEWFAKVYPLATVRSRNFLVHVIGQSMSTNTNSRSRPLATTRQLYQVYMEPVRATNTGLTTNVFSKIVSSWDL